MGRDPLRGKNRETTRTNHSQSEAKRTNHSHESLARTTHNPVWVASFPSAVPVSGSRQRFPVGVSRQRFPSAVPVSGWVATRSAENRETTRTNHSQSEANRTNHSHEPLTQTTSTNHSHKPLTRTTHIPKPLTRTTHTNHSHVPSGSRPAPWEVPAGSPRPDGLGDRVADPTTHKPLANH